ncbi:MAG: metal ABC transporter ATP-binding protein [Culicoidibacterales bacterium]
MLKFSNVSHQYKGEHTYTLKDATFTLKKGSYTSLVGQNGSGKSTLIKLALGYENTRVGDICLFDTPIEQFKEWHRIGYVPQNNQRYNRGIPATVQEVIETGLLCLHKKLSKAEKTEHVGRILEQLGLAGFEKKVMQDLSGGQQQRVFVARALVHNPELLIFDEPTVGIDKESVNQFYQLVGELNKQGKTIMLVSHDIHILNENVTDVIAIDQNISFSGSKQDYEIWHHNACHDCGGEL